MVGKRARARTNKDAETPAGGASYRYLESSAVVAALLDGDAGARQAVEGEGRRFASALTFAESARAVLRARLAGQLDLNGERTILRRLRRVEQRCQVAAISDPVLARASRPFAVEPVRTLDAIHLATVELLGETPQFVTIVTRDRRIRENALAMGYAEE